MDMNVPVYERSKTLHGPDHGRNAAVGIDFQRVNVPHGFPRCTAEFAKQTPVVAKINPQPSRDHKDPLTVRNFGKHFTIKPMAQKKGALLITGGAARTLTA
jgi:hypothetical protein